MQFKIARRRVRSDGHFHLDRRETLHRDLDFPSTIRQIGEIRSVSCSGGSKCNSKLPGGEFGAMVTSTWIVEKHFIAISIFQAPSGKSAKSDLSVARGAVNAIQNCPAASSERWSLPLGSSRNTSSRSRFSKHHPANRRNPICQLLGGQ